MVAFAWNWRARLPKKCSTSSTRFDYVLTDAQQKTLAKKHDKLREAAAKETFAEKGLAIGSMQRATNSALEAMTTRKQSGQGNTIDFDYVLTKAQQKTLAKNDDRFDEAATKEVGGELRHGELRHCILEAGIDQYFGGNDTERKGRTLHFNQLTSGHIELPLQMMSDVFQIVRYIRP